MAVILNLLPLTDEERAAFLAAAPGYDQIFCPSSNLNVIYPPAPAERYAGVSIILGNPTPADLVHAPELKFLQTWTAGTDPYLRPGVLPEGAALCSAVGAYGQSVSEHMLAMLLTLMKNLHLYRDAQHAGAWKDQGKVKSLVGATVLLAGTGDLGSSFARLCKALGARTVGMRRDPSKSAPGIDEMHALSEVDALLPLADVVAMTLPGTPETYHFMDARRLALMKHDAILVNAGRGPGVDMDALNAALREGRIRGAALDVTEPEPLPPDHPLWQCPNALITPHIAGGEHLDATRGRIASIVLDNLKRFLTGEPLRNRMN